MQTIDWISGFSEKEMKRLILLLAALLTLSSCGIYSFSGTSIQPDVNTITINFFEYRALKVNPSLSNDLTEAIRNQFRRMTRLEQVELDGDMELSGQITGYDATPAAVTADEVAALPERRNGDGSAVGVYHHAVAVVDGYL